MISEHKYSSNDHVKILALQYLELYGTSQNLHS